MGWGPSAIYVVEHTVTGKTERMRISDRHFERAQEGYTYPQTRICREFRGKVELSFGRDPGFILYKDLLFTKVRDIPSAAKRPPKMKAAGTQLKKSHATTLTPRR
jgi:hypothetical protein